MSLYIHGCDLPKEKEKILVVFPDGVVNEVERGTPYYEAKQLSPHGRLIDGKEFEKDVNESVLLTDRFKNTFNVWYQMQSTIIEAEGSGT